MRSAPASTIPRSKKETLRAHLKSSFARWGIYGASCVPADPDVPRAVQEEICQTVVSYLEDSEAALLGQRRDEATLLFREIFASSRSLTDVECDRPLIKAVARTYSYDADSLSCLQLVRCFSQQGQTRVWLYEPILLQDLCGAALDPRK